VRLERSRRARLAELERRCEFLDAEHRRLEALLADALLVATAGTEVCSLALLEALGVLHGENLGRAAWIEQVEREQAAAMLDRVLRVLRETA
jgi:hypothetical protein